MPHVRDGIATWPISSIKFLHSTAANNEKIVFNTIFQNIKRQVTLKVALSQHAPSQLFEMYGVKGMLRHSKCDQ